MKAYLKRKRRKRTLLVSGFLAILALILVLGYVFLIRPVFADERQVADNPPEVTGEAEPEPDPMAGEALVIPEPEPEPEEEPFDEFDIHVMMVGDDLLHDFVLCWFSKLLRIMLGGICLCAILGMLHI